jgi:hypothetical protein
LNRFVQNWGDLREHTIVLIIQRVHFNGLPFTGLTAAFSAHDGPSHEARMSMKPSTEHRAPGQLASHPCQVGKNNLRYIFGPVRVTIDQPKRRRIH